MKNRLLAAMGCYLALALAAYWQLSGKFRIAVWIFLAGLAVKTCLHWKHPGR